MLRRPTLTLAAFLTATLAATALDASGEARAQSQFAGTFAPIRTWAKPGETLARELRLQLVKSVTGQPLRFKAYSQDFWMSADGRSTGYGDPGKVKASCSNWVTVDPVTQEVAPGGDLLVRVSITVPAGTQPGGYWCAVSIDEQMDPRRKALLGGSGMVLFASFSNAVYVFVAPLQLDAKIKKLDIDSQNASVTVQSLANSPLLIEGHLEFLREGVAEPVAKVDLARRVLLPEPHGSVMTEAPLPPIEVLPDGDYLVKVVLDVGLDHLLGAQSKRSIKHAPVVPAGGAPPPAKP